MLFISGTKESEAVLAQAFKHMRRATSSELTRMKQNEQFTQVDWKMLGEYLPKKLLETTVDDQNINSHHKLSISSDQSSQLSRVWTDRKKSVVNNEIICSTENDVIVPLHNTSDHHRQKIRKELFIRCLTAMSIDYERQWYLGMIRRRTLDILIKSVEQAKREYSLKLHWELLVEQLRLPFFLLNLLRFNYFDLINQWINNLLFNHIFQTIELVLSKYFE